MSATPPSGLYPPLPAYRSGTLAVDDLHTVYWEQAGNPAGAPVLFLHGGPGGGASHVFRRLFDPAHYRIVLLDQRGAGRSTPPAECRDNTTALLVEDLECLRQVLGIASWLVLGGSWGATLALAYSQAHPERCTGLILRSVFLGSEEEIDWYLHGARRFHPDLHADFCALPSAPEGSLLEAYAALLEHPDGAVRQRAAQRWCAWEQQRAALLGVAQAAPADRDAAAALEYALARLEVHYFRHQCFLAPGQLLREAHRIAHLPVLIIQGRYDMLCPPLAAYRLHAALPRAQLLMVADAGHTAFQDGMLRALVAATDHFRAGEGPLDVAGLGATIGEISRDPPCMEY